MGLALGWDHTLMLSQEGNIYSCGSAKEGQCGQGARKDVIEPTFIQVLDKVFAKIEAGGNSSAAITGTYNI